MASESTSPSRVEEPRGFFNRWVLDFHNRTVLFQVGNWLFTTYAFLAGSAFAVGCAVSLWYDAMIGLDVVYMAKLYLFILLPAILIGLRSFSILLEWRELFRNPLQTIIKPGYMLHGGIAGGLVGFVIISQVSGVPMLRLLDGPALCLPLGEAIARLGCYVYGCCWGRPTESRFGVRYTSPDSKVVRAAPHLANVKIHPAQLYALVIYLAMFALFYAILPLLPFDGALAGLYFILHAFSRITLEFFRQDDRGKLWGKVTHTNMYSAAMIILGLAFWAVGSQSAGVLNIDMSRRLVHVMTNGTIAPWIALFGTVFGFAYGVHYGKVGSWIQKPSGGMKPNVDELSMGAAQRMEAQADESR
jgi:prolipoprotein diacylglyceryl transferase